MSVQITVKNGGQIINSDNTVNLPQQNGTIAIEKSASESQAGAIAIATSSEVQSGTNNTKAVSPLSLFSNYVAMKAQTLSEGVQTQILTNLGVIQALEQLITENGGTVPTTASSTADTAALSSKSSNTATDPWAEYNEA